MSRRINLSVYSRMRLCAERKGRSVSSQHLNSGISVVVPAYRSQRTIGDLVRRVDEVLQDVNYETIIVVDGSPDDTWNEVESLINKHQNVVGVRLGRNAGQHNALLAGLRHARYATTVTLDDDLQNPPEEIAKLVTRLTDGVDVVYGIPNRVAQSLFRRLGSSFTRKVLTVMLGAPNARELSSFRAFRTSLRDGFADELGPGVSLDALLAWSTDRFQSQVVRHDARAEGESNFNVRRLVQFALDMATGYSTRPLRFALRLGALTGLFGFILMATVLLRALISGVAVQGFPFLASTITLFSGVQLITIGVIGEYLARMHFRVMRKPSYVIAEVRRAER